MVEPAFVRSRYAHVKCLLIEDSEYDQRRIRRILDQAGIGQLDIVATVQDARRYLAGNRVDLILLDNGLPDGAGIDFALELRKHAHLANTPVVIVSDWPTPFMFDKALVARVKAVLRKDEFNVARVVEALSLSRGTAARKSQRL